jgi:hypothetical protein
VTDAVFLLLLSVGPLIAAIPPMQHGAAYGWA